MQPPSSACAWRRPTRLASPAHLPYISHAQRRCDSGDMSDGAGGRLSPLPHDSAGSLAPPTPVSTRPAASEASHRVSSAIFREVQVWSANSSDHSAPYWSQTRTRRGRRRPSSPVGRSEAGHVRLCARPATRSELNHGTGRAAQPTYKSAKSEASPASGSSLYANAHAATSSSALAGEPALSTASPLP
jgi:hypothetical protein